MGVQVGALRRQSYRFCTSIFENCTKGKTEVGISIHQQITSVSKKTIKRIGQVPGNLLHIIVAKCRRATGKVDASSSQLHNEQQLVCDQSSLGPNLDRREVDCTQNVPVGLDERFPGCLSLSFRRRFGAMVPEDIADGLIGYLVTQVSQSTLDLVISPGYVLASQPNNTRSTTSFPTRGRPTDLRRLL